MTRYIDADKLEKDFPQSVSKHNVTINGNEYPVFLVDHVLHKIRNYPTADVAEVVRCRKCKHHHLEREPCHGKTEHFCSRLNMQVFANFHCGYGERRDT